MFTVLNELFNVSFRCLSLSSAQPYWSIGRCKRPSARPRPNTAAKDHGTIHHPTGTNTHTRSCERGRFFCEIRIWINSEGDFVLCVIIMIIKLTTELLQLLLLSNLWCCDPTQPTHVSWHPTFNVPTTCLVVSLHKWTKWPLEWGFHHPDTSGSSLDWQDILSKLIKTRKFWLSPQKRMYASNFKVWNKIERKIINLIYLYRTFHANMQLKVLHMATLNQRRWNIKTLKR